MMNSNESLEIALKLAFLVKKLDKMIFGPNTAEIRIVRIKPKEGEGYLGYSSSGNFYQLFGFINEIVYEEIKQFRHLPSKLDSEFFTRKLNEYEKFPAYTIEEFLIASAAHEVRHHVQSALPITLFSQDDESKAKDPYLDSLILLQKLYYGIKRPNADKKEFDADVIMLLAGEILWRKKESSFEEKLHEIAELVKEDAKTLLARDKIVGGVNPPFLLLLSFTNLYCDVLLNYPAFLLT